MKVWVDQDVCTGDGLCEESCPSVFHLRDNMSFVSVPGFQPSFRGGSADFVEIPADMLDAVLDAAEDCPGECIFIDA